MLLVRADKVITLDPQGIILEDGAALISDSHLVAVGPYADLRRHPDIEVEIGGPGHWLLPGLVNAHHHHGGVFRSGFADAPLELLLFREGASMVGDDPELNYLTTLYTGLELLKSGVTCTVDFAYGSEAGPYLGLERQLHAYLDLGVRARFAPVARDQFAYVYGPDDGFLRTLPADVRHAVVVSGAGKRPMRPDAYFRGWENLDRDFCQSDSLARLLLAADGPQWCSPDYLTRLASTARERGVGLQMHLLETPYQALYGFRSLGASLVEHLDRWGVLGPELSCAHTVWVTAEDITRLADAGCSVIHCPGANLRLNSGIAPVAAMVAAGMVVGLGTDGNGADDDNELLGEMRLTSRLQRLPGLTERRLEARQVLSMATISAARALRCDREIGSIEVGKKADLVLLSTARLCGPAMSPKHDPYEILVTRARREDVTAVIVNGRIVLDHGRVITVAEVEILDRLQAARQKQAERAANGSRELALLLAAAEDYLTAYYSNWDLESLPAGYRYNAARPGASPPAASAVASHTSGEV